MKVSCVAVGWIVVLSACSGSPERADGGAGLPVADCEDRCEAAAIPCGAPEARALEACQSLCPDVKTAAQLACIEGSSCSELTAAFNKTGSVCGIGSTPKAGKFGDACKCQPDTTSGGGEFECSGTNICEPGLTCVGTRTQGVDSGRCRGPKCCGSVEECATAIGKQASCASNQVCSCSRGDYECVGDDCTCSGGVKASRGLCYPD
jgi:hypothetical protein